MAFTMRHSIQGKRVGLSSTGGLITKVNTGVNSTLPHGMAAQMWGESMFEAVAGVTASGTTLRNYGVSHITSGTATAITLEIGRPEPGVSKTIAIATTCEHLTLGGTSTAIIFRPAVAGAGSSMFISSTYTFGPSPTANMAGLTIQLVGVSTAEWAFIGDNGSSAAGHTVTIG